MTSEQNYLADMDASRRAEFLQKISYTDFIHQFTNTPKEVTDIFRDRPRGIWGVGWDATSALEGYRWNNPGMAHLQLGDIGSNWLDSREDEPYIFHFPDGNAGSPGHWSAT